MNKPGPKSPCPCGSGKYYKQCCRTKGLFTGKPSSVNLSAPLHLPGIDYGIKPTMMLVGDLEYSTLISDHLDAIGYGYISYPDRPVISFCFDSSTAAKSCFGKFKRWMDEGNSEDALRITFVRIDEGEYALCITQDIDSIERRLLPAACKDLYDPLVMGCSHMKTFTFASSSGIDMVKEHAGRKVFHFECMSRPEVFPELSFDKQHVNYYTAAEYRHLGQTMDNASERTVVLPYIAKRLGQSISNAELPEKRDERPIPSPHAVQHQRNRLLKRFFPVTVERLSFTPEFREIEAHLASRGYAAWQVRQAACNISLLRQTPEIFSVEEANISPSGYGGVSVASRILDRLVKTPEMLVLTTGVSTPYSADELVRQMDFDTRYLLDAVRMPPDLSEDNEQVQTRLRESHYHTEGVASGRQPISE